MKWNFSCIFFTLIVPYGYLLVTADTHYTSKFLSSNVDGYGQYDRSGSHHQSQLLSSQQSSDDYPSANNKRLFHVNNDLGSRSEPVWVQDHISIPLPEKTLDIESHSEDEEDEESTINHQEEYDDLDNNLPLIPNNQDESSTSNATSIGNGKDDRHKHQSATERDTYLIVTQKLANLTTLSGKKIRLRCSFKSYPPARVRWLKNEAPLEVGNRRTKGKWSIRLIRSASTGKITSRLLINHLDVHDTGYYKCEAENGHLTAETSGVLMVLPVSMNSPSTNSENNLPNAILTSENFGPLHTASDVPTNPILPSQPFQPVAIGVSNFPKVNLSSFSTSILPISSPSNNPSSSGSCHLYTGRICSQFIGNRSVYIPQGADQFDLEHDLVTIAELIAKSPQISPQCHRYAISSICLFSFPLCINLEQKSDPFASASLKPHRLSPLSEFSGTTQIRKICREECEILENNICHKEYSMARNIAVINRNLLPDCQKLPILGSPEDYECIQLGIPSSVRPLKGDQICFNDNGEKYRGIIDRTVSGKKCLPWSTVADTINHDELLGGHNYCRNPDSSETRPWCIVSFETHQKELCDIPRCDHFQGSNHLLAPSIAIVSVSGLVLFACCLRMLRSRRKSFSTETKIAIPSSTAPFSAYSAYIATQNDHDNQQQAHPTLISPLICNKKGYSPVHLASPASSVTGLWIEHPLLDNQLHTSTATLYQQFKQPHYHSHQQLQNASSKSNLNQYSRQSIKITGKLSESDFGDIFSGELLIPLGVVISVAIRTLRDDCSPNTIENFKNEAQTLAQLQHPNIVCLLGVCFTDKPMCMMFELMGEGDLLRFLHKHSPHVSRKTKDRFVDRDHYHTSNESCDGDESSVLTSSPRSPASLLDLHDLLYIGIQIAAGMEYLSSKHFTHRDLACRNCFVSDYLNIKISNFRLNHVDYSSDYYCIPNNSSIPVRWLPPESIFYERFTSASDTWSFGVLLWEVFTFGQQPYSHSTNEEVIELIRTHNLLPCPENCPPAYYAIMLDCWKRDPSMRPDFSELHTKLKALQAVESIRSNKSTFHCINSHKSGKSSSPQPHQHHRTPENGINLNGSSRDIGPMSSPRRTRRANAMMISCKDISSNDKIYSKLSCPFNNSTSSSLGFV
ncbi:tyrosine-protein kinase transmembrane receptor Ror-like [Brevipalpus obovatus]|uniref:tyrosine-protein kinase transmembrane receptor Ror-like n=1 Tax=Brevipalpus obovatus TaxID=246614 RepID=UPI003D9E361B